MSRFEDFWRAWPVSGSPGFEDYTRKGNKKKCREKWDSLKLDEKADVIIRNVEQRAKYDKGWRDKRGKYLCAPLVYLNNEQWDDGEFADLRDERKPKARAPSQPQFDPGPPMSKYARYANKKLLDLIIISRGIGDDEKLAELVRKKNEVVSQAEREGDWEDDDFKSVIKATLAV